MLKLSDFRPQPIKPQNGISPRKGILCSDTTYKIDYQDLYPQSQSQLLADEDRRYSDKCLELLYRVDPFKPRHNICIPHSEFVAKTVYSDHFKSPTNTRKVLAIIPSQCMSPPHGKITFDTTYQREYKNIQIDFRK